MALAPPEPKWVTLVSIIFGSGLTVSVFSLTVSSFIVIPNISLAADEANNEVRITFTNDGFAAATNLRLLIWSSGNITDENVIFPGEEVSLIRHNPNLLLANVSVLPVHARIILGTYISSPYNISVIYDQGSKYFYNLGEK